MKHVRIFTLVLSFSIFAFPLMAKYSKSSSNGGIKWTKDLSWEAIKAKAKLEKKYIFIDCFATWCIPCKKMDQEVFSAEELGEYMDDKFIAVKVQMDRTKKDSENAKSWYAAAQEIDKLYRVNSYPTYIFLNPSGEIVHKATGFTKLDKFLMLAKNIIIPGKDYHDPYKEYFEYVDLYRKGKRDYNKMPQMFLIAKSTRDKELATELANTYYAYLETKSAEQIYHSSTLEFLAATVRSESKYLNLFFPDGHKVDNVLNIQGFSSYIIDSLIQNEIISKYLRRFGRILEPDWTFLTDTITRIYNSEYAIKNVQFTRLRWHEFQALDNRDYNRWDEYKVLYFDYLKKYGDSPFPGCGWRFGMAGMINNFAWEGIFKREANEEQIRLILPFFKREIEKDRSRKGRYGELAVDTYANLLYKYALLYCKDGSREVLVQQALHWEETAMSLAYEFASNALFEEFKKKAEKMSENELIWE